ncbi:Fc.00g107310.m01.CDS01 [Cosmosporella sp. VM-42]
MASSPQSNSDYETSAPKKHEQITFRFCSECSNMLYPKEDHDAHKLQFTCRTCQYTEEAQSTCVFRNDLNTQAGETAGVTQDVGSDPTVSELLPVLCHYCGDFISSSSSVEPDSKMFVDLDDDEAEDESMDMCQFMSSWNEDDPFAEYDEEMMDEPDTDSDNASSSDASEIICDDGTYMVNV